jgi:hypothetical protein
MRVVELKELNRKEAPIHYIRQFTAVALLESNDARAEAEVAFTLEGKAVGPPELSLRVLDPIEWPLLPVMRVLREHIMQLESAGRLI